MRVLLKDDNGNLVALEVAYACYTTSLKGFVYSDDDLAGVEGLYLEQIGRDGAAAIPNVSRSVCNQYIKMLATDGFVDLSWTDGIISEYVPDDEEDEEAQEKNVELEQVKGFN